MKLDAPAFGIGHTVAAAIVYAICSFFVGFLPDIAANLAGNALHVNLSGILKPVNLGGFVIGLLVVSVGWGLLSFVAAAVYNSLAQNAADK